MRSLPGSYIAAKNALHSTAPMVFLLQVDLDGTNALRVCGYDTAILFGGQTYSPMAVTLEGFAESSDGTLAQPRVVLTTVLGGVIPYLQSGGVVDRTVRIRTVLTTDLTNSIDWGSYEILDASASLASVEFRLGVTGLTDGPFPAKRVTRGRCGARYGGPECGYDTTQPNSIAAAEPNFDPTTCDLTMDGENGCRAHGRNEIANGRPRLHPLRFEGHPSLPRGSSRV